MGNQVSYIKSVDPDFPPIIVFDLTFWTINFDEIKSWCKENSIHRRGAMLLCYTNEEFVFSKMKWDV